MSSKIVKQHFIPKTYLRRFCINPADRKLKSFIFCYVKNQYKSSIRMESIDSNLFKIDSFYTLAGSEDPEAFEFFLGKEVEPLYNLIMEEIEGEKELSSECKDNLIIWLYYNKFRSKWFRENIDRLAISTLKIIDSFKRNKKVIEIENEEFIEYSKGLAKGLQLEALADPKLITSFKNLIEMRDWKIIKSETESFLTNDDPGFSIAIENGVANFISLSRLYLINTQNWIFFVLSPRYCLVIAPYPSGLVNFEICPVEATDLVNICTMRTKRSVLISSKRDLLEKYESQF